MSTTANYTKEINIPQNYSEYYEELSKQVYKEFETAADAKSTLLDSSGIIEPKIAAAYSLAAQFFGMRFVYLEAGSGAKTNVTPEMVATVRKVFQGFLIVGGGIRDAQTAKSLTDAGADALVIGTLLEDSKNLEKLTEIDKAIKN